MKLPSPALPPFPPQMDFGPRYYGEASQQQVQVFNNGPIEARYTITFGTAREMKARLEEEQVGGAVGGAGGGEARGSCRYVVGP